MKLQKIGKNVRHFYDMGKHTIVVYVAVATMLDDKVFDVACYIKAFSIDDTEPYNENYYVERTAQYGDKISRAEATAIFPGLEPYTYRY